jgi:hypothetical protein
MLSSSDSLSTTPTPQQARGYATDATKKREPEGRFEPRHLLSQHATTGPSFAKLLNTSIDIEQKSPMPHYPTQIGQLALRSSLSQPTQGRKELVTNLDAAAPRTARTSTASEESFGRRHKRVLANDASESNQEILVANLEHESIWPQSLAIKAQSV